MLTIEVRIRQGDTLVYQQIAPATNRQAWVADPFLALYDESGAFILEGFELEPKIRRPEDEVAAARER